MVRLFTLALASENVRLLPASEAATGLALARSELPDLILLDRLMPGMDGLELCRALRADQDLRLREVPVLMLTSQVEHGSEQEGLDAGVSQYLAKSLGPAQLRSHVRRWLNRRS